MEFPFYNNNQKAYTINDAGFECWKIIIADCPNSHRYATLCELIEDCPSVKQLTKSCVVNFLNNANSAEYTKWLDQSKRFVKVNAQWCLEIADPCVCDTWDRLVAATEWDNNPWELDKKVKWSCSYDGLYCIDIEEAWPQLLVWRPSWPNWPFINPKVPDWDCSNDYYVKMKKSWWNWAVDYECPETSIKPQYALCTYLSWIAHTTCKDRTVRYFATRADWAKPEDTWTPDNSNSYLDWDWVVRWTAEAFTSPTSYWVIKIKMSGIYEIAFSTYVTFWQVLHSIRCWLYMNDWTNWRWEINDIKYQTWEYWIEWMPEVFNRNRPEERDKEKFIKNWQWEYKWASWTMEATWLPFARTYVLNITTPTEIALVVKPDMRWTDPRLIKENNYDSRYLIEVAWWNGNPYWASTTIEIARIWDSVHDSRIIPI